MSRRPRSTQVCLGILLLSACSKSSPPAPGATSDAPAVSALSGSASAASSAVASAAPAASSAPTPVDDGPRIYSRRRHAWIYYTPNASGGWAGFLGLGSSVKLRSTTPKVGNGCAAFYPVEPRGFVCLNEKTTLDPNDPEYAAIRPFAPKLDRPNPHFYGESRGTPRYVSIPTPKQQRQREYKLDEHLENVEALRSGKLKGDDIPKVLRGVDPKPAGVGPPPELAKFPRGIQEERNYLGPGSTVSWSYEFDAEGRTWLLTGDLALVPKDKVSIYPRSKFRGVPLGDGVSLPIAFVREKPRPKYRRADDGSVQATGETWPRLAWFGLTGDKVKTEEKTYLVTRDDGLLVEKSDATPVHPAPFTPWGAPVEGADTKDKSIQRVPQPEGGRSTWLDISVLSGWLVAYENTRPVFVTLISPGRGGVPAKGIDPLKTASTPVGSFRVDGKFFTSTMANEAWVHSDVPFCQNFHGPHVLHQAYWHESWGEKKSGGCVNLSPHDGLHLFHWTEPPIPPGWYGMRSDDKAGPATVVMVHR